MTIHSSYDNVPQKIAKDMAIILRYLTKKNGGTLILPTLEEMEQFEDLNKKDVLDKYTIKENNIIIGTRLKIVRIA